VATRQPFRFELTEQTRDAVGAWIAQAGLSATDYLFPSRRSASAHLADKGVGRQIVEAVVSATPADWLLAVPMDWSGGFWQRMARDYPRLQVF
jgi:hypothetical protein